MNQSSKNKIKKYLLNNYGLTAISFKLQGFQNSRNYNIVCKSNFSDLPIIVYSNHLKHQNKNLHKIYINGSPEIKSLDIFHKIFPRILETSNLFKSFKDSLEDLNSYLMNFFLKKYLKADVYNYFEPYVYSLKLGYFNECEGVFYKEEQLLFCISLQGLPEIFDYTIVYGQSGVYFNTIQKVNDINLSSFSKNKIKETNNPLTEDFKVLSNSILQNCATILNRNCEHDIYDFSNITIQSLSEIENIIDSEYKIKSIVKY